MNNIKPHRVRILSKFKKIQTGEVFEIKIQNTKSKESVASLLELGI
jgi:TusA-related sulfurtransferase